MGLRTFLSAHTRKFRAAVATGTAVAALVGVGIGGAGNAFAGGPNVAGYMDSVTFSGNYVTANGWTMDIDYKSVRTYYYVGVYSGSNLTLYSEATGLTSVDRPDVNAALGATNRHGFSRAMYVPASIKYFRVCTWGSSYRDPMWIGLTNNCKTFSRV